MATAEELISISLEEGRHVEYRPVDCQAFDDLLSDLLSEAKQCYLFGTVGTKDVTVWGLGSGIDWKVTLLKPSTG